MLADKFVKLQNLSPVASYSFAAHQRSTIHIRKSTVDRVGPIPNPVMGTMRDYCRCIKGL